MKKRMMLALLLLALILPLAACGGPEGTYKQAQDLLSKGKFAEAAEKFESIGSFEDAATLAIYCKACALCESGNFETGITALEKLGDYKDSALRVTYYTARYWDDNSVGTTEFEKMERAKAIYNENPLYLDSMARITALDQRIEKAKADLYAAAVDAGENGDYSYAQYIFDRLDTYQDSQKRYTYYGIRADERALNADAHENAVFAVAEKYAAIGAFLDATDRVAALKKRGNAILDGKYDAAMALKNAGKYEDAIAAFKDIENHKDSAAQITACETAILDGKYDAAVVLMEAGKYHEAYETFESLQGHKESEENAIIAYQKYKISELKTTSIGSYIMFGNYEQDDNSDNGAEEIEWLVLAKENDRLLVISRYALAIQFYNKKDTSVTWETCTLRTWLNSKFLNVAFNNAEKTLIPMVTVPADKNPNFSTDPGNATQDQIFLLSILEINKYFSSDYAMQCIPTTSIAKYCGQANDGRFCYWWLRSPGNTQNYAAYISDGINESGSIVNHPVRSVRPAMWIDLNP